MRIDLRTIKKDEMAEIYITSLPTPNIPVKKQAEEIFSGIRDVLESKNASILQERVFATAEALEIVRPIRANVYGKFDDGVDPTWLVVPVGMSGQISGVQMHAVTGSQSLQILRLQDKPCGRIMRGLFGKCLALSGISAPEAGSAPEQCRRMYEKSDSLLKQAGVDMLSVARTWMWLGNILQWYDDFNGIRSQFFIERGLIRKGMKSRMPASTAIGIGPNNGGSCTMDIIAVIEPANSIEYLDKGGKQNSPYSYGSAFSRASKANTLAGSTIFVSGTASVAVSGKTIHLGDPEAQIQSSIDNVRAILTQMNCKDDDVVQAIVYSKTPEIEKLFSNKCADLPWPHIMAIADICRDDLLFEIEATAVVAG